MPRKLQQEPRFFWVPMRWTMNGGGWVQALDAQEAREKAEKGSATLQVEGAELVDWEVTGDAKEQL